jgi:hypothetical protein
MFKSSLRNKAGLFTMAFAEADPSDLILYLGITLKMLLMLNAIDNLLVAAKFTPKSVTLAVLNQPV